MAADAAAAAAATFSISPTEYDVFLSFRGQENFTSHLYTALTKAGFRTFLGDGDGGEVSIHRSELNEAILESRVFIIVLSQHYVSSRCCLDDLLTILSCKRRYRRVVIPVFLGVDPSDVRHQTGSVAEAMKFVGLTKQRLMAGRQEERKSYTEMDRKTNPKLMAGRQEEFKSYTGMDRETIRYPPKRGKIKARIFEDLVETLKSFTEMGHITNEEFKSYTEMDHETKQKSMEGAEAKIGKWREALTEAGNLSGIYLGNIDHDPDEKFIEKVVEGIVEEVSTSAQGLVGVPNYKIYIEDWENAPQKKTVVSHARFLEYESPRPASLPDHYDKSLIITANKQQMSSNLLPDSVREISRLQSLALMQVQGTKSFEGVVLENHPARSSFGTYNAKRSWYKKHEKIQDKPLSDLLRLVPWGPHKKILIPTEPFINMVALDMSYNKMEQAWQGIMFLPSLKILNLSHSKYLWRTPDFSGVLNLKSLILEGCASLVKVSETIGLVERLTLLNLEDCKSLTNLPRSICTLPCLETLILSGCSSLEFTMELGYLKSLKEFLAKDTRVLLLNSHQTDRMKTSTQAPRRFRNVYQELLKRREKRKMKVALSPELKYEELKQKAKVVKQEAELLNRMKDFLLLILSYPTKPEATVDFELLANTFSFINRYIRELEADKIYHQSEHEYCEFLIEEEIPLLFQKATEFFINSDFDMVAYLPEDIVKKRQSHPLEYDVSVTAKSSANSSKFEEATRRPDDILPTPPEVYTWANNFAISQASRYVKDSAFNSIAISGSGGNIRLDVLKLLREIRSLFDVVLYISVSQHQSHRTIERDIVQQINIWKIGIGSTEISMPPPKVLLLLDCIDESINLYNLHIPDEPNLGFPIQVQTVLLTQSQKAYHIMPVDLEIRMEDHLLPWNLFCRNVGQVMDHSSALQHIAVRLIEGCHSHLLAIIVLGRALKGETNVAVWELALHELTTSLQSSPEAEGSSIVMAHVLKFIWERKDTVTKHCIKKYCTSQTKGTKGHKDSLVSCWIADSLIEKQQQGEDVLEDLINSFLLEIVDGDSVRMREEIRLILLSAYIPQPNGLYLKLGNLELTETPKAEEWDTKEIHLMNNRLSELPDNPKCPALAKLFLQSNYDLTEIPSTFFEYMPVLQVLDLSNTSLKSLNIPSISRLVELQELLLRGCELLMELPPEIGALRNLKVFDLDGTEIVYLPEELRELINLECLKFSLYGYADSYKESKGIDAIIPRTTLSKLTQLKELSINVDPCGEWWNVEVKAIFEELPSLRKLETLKLYVPTTELLQQFVQLEWNVDGLSIYSNLSHFRLIVGSEQQRLISRVPFDLEEEFLKLEKCLKYINGEGNTNQFAEALKHANTLFLDRHWSIEKLSVFKIDKLNELKDCLLVDCNEMHTVFDGSDFYEGDSLSLQNLHIYYLKNLEFIWKGPVVGSCLPHLKILALHMCPNLTTVVTPMLLQNLELLEEIIVEDCLKIETVVILDSSHPTLSDHSLQRLKKISLSDLPELVNIFSDQCIVPKLETMDIYDCPKLKILSSVEVCNKEIIKGEWWDVLECNEPERSSADFSQLDVDQLAADGYSLHLFLKDRETLQ